MNVSVPTERLLCQADLLLGRPETRRMTRSSLVALHDHDLPRDIMNFEMSTEVVHRVGVKGGDLLMRHHHDRTSPQVETAFERRVAATHFETFPRAIRLAVLRR
jgi:hypothetical protein